MKRSIYYLLCLVLLFASCEKVVDLKLKEGPVKYVIEGNVTDQPGPYTVKISQTVAFNTPNGAPGVSGAVVVISDNTGFQETLQPNGVGVYTTSQLQGKIGNTYYVKVTIGSQEFTASSTMPQVVPFDSLYTIKEFAGSKTQINAVPVFTDPIGHGNNYLFNQYINGVLDKTIYCQNDDFTDGQKSAWSLARSDPDSTLHIGDNIRVEMQCIDRNVYTYWNTMDLSSTGNGNGIPGNPVSNIIGGAFGYFSAHTSRFRSLTVTQ